MFEKPQHLSDIGGEAFDRVQVELQDAGIKGVGFDVVERYAVTYALWLECQARVRHEKMTWPDGSRNLRMIDLHKLNASVAAIRREMGLGVTVRADVHSQPDESDRTAESDDKRSTTGGLPLRYDFSQRN